MVIRIERENCRTTSDCLIALFVLLIACINFINLSTARASIRAKEIGVKKVSGAERRSIIIQFMLESFLQV
ncbi:MAG TPA: FtsX-like permease family protein, partial [Bacteroidales bacterium]|nr:FtsX-like permease family protein [Bacteroidales bacterium]